MRTPTAGPAVLAALAAALLAAAAVATWARGSDAPIRFNHAAHVKAKIDCTSCHLGVMDPSESRLPALDTCTGCHKDSPGANPGKQALARLAAAGEELRWPKPGVRQPDHVFFSHPRHVDVAKLECTVCHGDVARSTAPPRTRRMSMYTCEGCHASHPESVAATRARIDCMECHR
jgi:hypothetical protein